MKLGSLLRGSDSAVNQFVMGRSWELLEGCGQRLQQTGFEPGSKTLKSCQLKEMKRKGQPVLLEPFIKILAAADA